MTAHTLTENSREPSKQMVLKRRSQSGCDLPYKKKEAKYIFIRSLERRLLRKGEAAKRPIKRL